MPRAKVIAKTLRPPKVITKANRRPTRGKWPPDPKRVRSILDGLEELYPDVDCELDRETPFQLLCATILSAQCTDERVNRVTPALFKRYPDARAMARAELPDLEELIRSTGFFRQKAKSLRGAAQALLAAHSGEIPRTRDALTGPPGWRPRPPAWCSGRRSASRKASSSTPTCRRLAMRLGLTRATDVRK